MFASRCWSANCLIFPGQQSSGHGFTTQSGSFRVTSRRIGAAPGFKIVWPSGLELFDRRQREGPGAATGFRCRFAGRNSFRKGSVVAAGSTRKNGGLCDGEDGLPLPGSDNSAELPSKSSSDSERLEDCAPVGTVLGAVALITGTSVGAGILALPVTTGPAGFVPSAAVLGACWSFLSLQAILLAKVNVGLMQRLEKSGSLKDAPVISLRTMAEETLGPWGGSLVAVTYLFLTYTLMVAYIVKAEEVMSSLSHIPEDAAAVAFTIGLGGVILAGGTKVADSVNQVFTFGLIGSFLVLVVGGAAIGNWANLERMDWTAAPRTIPVVFLALVYHDLIPVLCSYLGGDMKRIELSLVLGSALPLAMLLSWDAVALSLASVSGTGDPLDALLRSSESRLGFGFFGAGSIVQIFALLAVATSFIGSYLGLFEFFVEQLVKCKDWIADRVKNSVPESPATKVGSGMPLPQVTGWLSTVDSLRLISFALVLAPPLAISVTLPNSAESFLSATDLAGAYGMTVMYGIFPPLMAWSWVHKNNTREETGRELEDKPTLLVGKPALAGLSACAAGVILLQIVGHSGYFDGGAPPEIILAASNDITALYLSYP